ncbi:tyrosine-protein phosphatase [Rhodococcus globerulus]|nr:tyrosine-protein phosphatase [Rhodococcus globerulus]
MRPTAEAVACHSGGADLRTPPLVGTTNTRDIGGFGTDDGRTVARGRLYRADVLGVTGSAAETFWLPENAPLYRALGLRTVVDLRSVSEAELVPSAWATETGAHLLRAAIPEGVEGTATDFMSMLHAGTITEFGPDDLGRWYSDVLDRRASVFGQILRTLSRPDRYPALIHCHAGKDRTGLTVALILDTLQVPREEILRDYAATGINRRESAAKHADLVTALGLDLDAIKTFWEAPMQAMSIALTHLDSEYGGTVGFLESACGVSARHIDALKGNLLEGAHR